MAQWYVKDLSKLTDVSVQTLHHYDRIGLLKPSVRLPNGYRLYSEKDLLKLQQIIALKFFGFELAQIKKLLATEVDVLTHFTAQSKTLEEKSKALAMANNALQAIISECKNNKSIPWESIIKSIEVYRMTEKLENKWAKKVFSEEELKTYVGFEQELKNRFSETELDSIHKGWNDIVIEVEKNLDKDPNSTFGISLGKRTMTWVNHVYGPNHVALRNTIWTKGFKEDQIPKEDADQPLSPKGVAWLDQAISAYYRNRIYTVLAQVGKESENKVLKKWNELLVDMHGNEASQNAALIEAVMNDENISEVAKEWVKNIVPFEKGGR